MRWVFVGQGPMGAAALHALCVRRLPVAVLTTETPGAAGPVANVAAARGLEVTAIEGLAWGEGPIMEPRRKARTPLTLALALGLQQGRIRRHEEGGGGQGERPKPAGEAHAGSSVERSA